MESSGQACAAPETAEILQQYVIHQDNLVSAGLSLYPTTPAQVIVRCRRDGDLMSTDVATFCQIFLTVREIASTVASVLHVHRCGLTYDGSHTISVIPLHLVSEDWRPMVHGEEEYYAEFPGYITSKNGPEMGRPILESIRNSVAKVSGISQPLNTRFDGDPADINLFARLVRGEIPQSRVWEDDSYVAFLTPYGNTRGFTIIVPRQHLLSDIFALGDEEFCGIVRAAHTVAQYLKEACAIERCGMFFEGYEIDYAHVKLVPIHVPSTQKEPIQDHRIQTETFYGTYQGYLTTQAGPLALDLDSITAQAKAMRDVHPRTHAQATSGGVNNPSEA